jgi:hypothetical protein
LVGFVDYGCAFANRQFWSNSDELRIAALWDQQDNDRPAPPASRRPLGWTKEIRFGYGRVVRKSELAAYVAQFRSKQGSVDEATCYSYAQYEPVLRAATHGTHIMDVATGHPDPLRHLAGKSPADSPHEAAIAFVQLPRYRGGAQVAGLLKAQLLDAVHFIAGLRAHGQRAIVNASYGSYCGPHDGSSILELALDELIGKSVDSGREPRLSVVIPAGNASELGCHAQVLIGSLQRQSIAWSNVPDDPSDSFAEIWIPAGASARVRVTPPGLESVQSQWVEASRALRLQKNGQTIAMLIHAARPCQSLDGSLVLFATRSTSGSRSAPYGSWRIEIENTGSGPVVIDAWCERDDPVFGTEGGPRQARFESHVERTGTLNSIAHGRRTIVVGGCDVSSGASSRLPGKVSSVSSSGPGRGRGARQRHAPVKREPAKNGPEVLAPCDMGLDEPGLPGAAVPSGDQVRLMGTSVAAAAYTRWLLEHPGTKGLPPIKGGKPPRRPAQPGRDPHPDDEELIPRIP